MQLTFDCQQHTYIGSKSPVNNCTELFDDEKLVYSFVEQVFSEIEGKKIQITFIEDFSTEMSIVIKLNVSHDSFNQCIFIKRERQNHELGILKREFDNLSKLNQVKSELFNCAEIFAFSEEKNILILKECKGKSFFDLIIHASRWPGQLFFSREIHESTMAVGRWLKFREECSIAYTSHKYVKDNIQREISEAEENITRSKFKKQVLPLFVRCKNIINDKMDKVIISDNFVYLAHGDFHPGNFFVNNANSVSAIDFQHVEARFIGYDALYFESILLLSFGLFRYNPIFIKKLFRSFLQGYNRKPKENSDLVMLIKAVIVIRALVFLSSTYEPKKTLSKIKNFIDLKKLSYWLRY